MEITKKNRRDYDKTARPRRDYDGKPTKEHGRPSAGRKFGDKPYDRKPGTGRHFEGKPGTGDKPFDRKPGTGKPFERKTETGKPAFRKPTVRKKAAPAAAPTEERLNKFIANSGICSRREADKLIQAGVVTVNGKVVTELGIRIDVRKDVVLFGGQRLHGEDKVYIIMNKPKGFVTTTSDPHAEQTVMDLLTKCPTRVFPVGRLDKNTTGVLMFTNDGEMAEKLTHPSFNKKKIYEVLLDRKLSGEDFNKILSGINLEDGPIKADELSYVDAEDQRRIGIEIHSGKNRIVRRIFESLGYQVKGLDRVYFAGLTKKGIKRGAWRYLTEGEVNILKMGAFN
ncbi:MAG: rRNA pseudouridine synthase [Bacteroidales bacterium]|nr:rRNA pseudouridine synthase [Candidatus Hennigimonas equi]